MKSKMKLGVFFVSFLQGFFGVEIEELCYGDGGAIGAQSITYGPNGSSYFSDKGSSKIYYCSNNTYEVYTGQAGVGFQNGDVQKAKFNKPMSITYCGQKQQEGLYVADNKCFVRFINTQGIVSTFLGSDTDCQKPDNSTGVRLTYVSALSCSDDLSTLLIMNSGSGATYKVPVGTPATPSTPTPTPTPPSKQIIHSNTSSKEACVLEKTGMEIWLPILTLLGGIGLGYASNLFLSRYLPGSSYQRIEEQQKRYLDYKEVMLMIWKFLLILHWKKTTDIYYKYLNASNVQEWLKKLWNVLYAIKFVCFVYKRRRGIFHVLHTWMMYEDAQFQQNQDLNQKNKQPPQNNNLIDFDSNLNYNTKLVGSSQEDIVQNKIMQEIFSLDLQNQSLQPQSSQNFSNKDQELENSQNLIFGESLLPEQQQLLHEQEQFQSISSSSYQVDFDLLIQQEKQQAGENKYLGGSQLLIDQDFNFEIVNSEKKSNLEEQNFQKKTSLQKNKNKELFQDVVDDQKLSLKQSERDDPQQKSSGLKLRVKNRNSSEEE